MNLNMSRRIWDVEKGVVGKVLERVPTKVFHSHRIKEGSCTQLCANNKHIIYDTMDTIQRVFCSHIFILLFFCELFKLNVQTWMDACDDPCMVVLSVFWLMSPKMFNG